MKTIKHNPDGLTVHASCLLYFFFFFFLAHIYLFIYVYVFPPPALEHFFFFPRVENEIGISV